MADAFVYLLRCADDSLYCGWTVDPERRLAAHAAGRGSTYVGGRLPARYAALWRAASAGHARSAEAHIKRLGRDAKLALVRGGPLPSQLGRLVAQPLPPATPS